MNTIQTSQEGPLLVMKDVVKRYGGLTATDHVSLSIQPGEVLGIIGPNGAGKSTLIGLLGGALQASEGRIVFLGQDVTTLAASERARLGIGRTYQIPRPFMDMTVRENLLAARYSLHPFASAQEVQAACDHILQRTGMLDAADLPARGLPLLRRKRLEVARALALDPKLLLLDEVGAGLVDAEVSELIELIQSLRSEVAGIVIIEHVLRVVRECCERLVVINFGKKIAEGPTSEVLASEEVSAVYLGTAHGQAPAPDAPGTPAVPLFQGSLNALWDAQGLKQAKQSQQPLLQLQGVHAGYGQARVLNGIDLSVHPGQVMAILGTNGAGKTTLAHVLSGAIRPTSGQYLIDGKNVTGLPAHVITHKGIAQCMEGRRIFSPLTVEENLMLAARSVAPADMRVRLDQVYALFPDLKERRRQSGTSMSGGQQQMLAIGRALMSRPRLVLFDEISLGLAPVMMDRLYQALSALRELGLTMLIVEQDVERALDLADAVHVMEHGRFALSGPASSIRHDPMLRHLYIGTAD
ncbi:ATP-binding cassette domain-containing protein [Aquabacterium sp.]|uniref:ATP-binding cassette domain-containing protein n=1 Tax=Aquabacterium sp. TaxID=1872578 RepID=UPI0025C477E0|nr:ATP-binding cassette domain-containing protein [Aquabacterium sp.]